MASLRMASSLGLTLGRLPMGAEVISREMSVGCASDRPLHDHAAVRTSRPPSGGWVSDVFGWPGLAAGQTSASADAVRGVASVGVDAGYALLPVNQGGAWPSPLRRAIWMASERSWALILVRMLETWLRTVLSER